MKALLWAERKEAEGRSGTRIDLGVNLPRGSGKSRDKVAELFGVSGSTVQKHVAVVERIDRQGGFLLASMGRHTPGRPKLSRDGTVFPTLDELGINRNQASRCQKMAGIDEARFEEHIARIRDSDDGELTTQGVLLLAQAGCIIRDAATR